MEDAPLRILTLADTPPDENSGAAGTEVRTIEALRALGHHVDAIWRDDMPHRIKHPNLHIVLELPKAYRDATARALARAEYDVVHVNQPHGFLAARLVHRIAPRTLFVHRSHGLESNAEETLKKWRKTYEKDERSPARRIATLVLEPLLARHPRLNAREADAHNLLCSRDADFLQAHFGVDPAKIGVIPMAPPDAFLEMPAPLMTAARLQCVLHVAQFAFFKAPMITAAAMNRLASMHPNLKFIWVCNREHHDDVRALLSNDVLQRLELLHWRNQDDLRALYDRSGIFLFPSFFEGFGKAFLEAMSRGMCVVASDAGGMHDVIRSGVDGVLVPPGDTERLAAEAHALLNDLPRAAVMSEAAAARAREYSWDRVARETADFYRSRLAVLRKEKP
ncbi:MAG TPA: glycosyltransferase family 4 protein [Thermoanaerobaculia bacterium]|jgi:glycosyltransferase involved in cell wall biosynthesis